MFRDTAGVFADGVFAEGVLTEGVLAALGGREEAEAGGWWRGGEVAVSIILPHTVLYDADDVE